MADIPAARAKLQAAATTEAYWPLHAAGFAVVAVLIGASLHQESGAIAGAMVAYFVGKFLQESAKAKRASAIEAAEANLRETQASTTKTMSKPHNFSRAELLSGEPDAISRHLG